MEAQEENKVSVGWIDTSNHCKHSVRDLDEIDSDLAEGKVEKLLSRAVDYDKTGLGQFYCVHCS